MKSVQGCPKKKFAENNTFWAQLLKLFVFNRLRYIFIHSSLVKGKGKVECSSCHTFYQLICYDIILYAFTFNFAIYFTSLFVTIISFCMPLLSILPPIICYLFYAFIRLCFSIICFFYFCTDYYRYYPRCDCFHFQTFLLSN